MCVMCGGVGGVGGGGDCQPAASSSASVLKNRTVESRWHSPPSVKALATNVPSAHTW